MYRIKSILIIIYNKLLKMFHCPPPIMSNAETIYQLAIEGKSLGRYGDGEMMLIEMSNDLSFQKMNKELSQRLDEIIRTTDKGFLVGIPRVFTDTDLQERKESSVEFWNKNLMYTRYMWYKRIKFNHKYANSTFTRNYLTLKDKSSAEQYFESVKKIWESRKILMIEGEHSRVGVGNDLFSNAIEIKRILCPSSNAYDVYEQILESALKISREYLVLIALGPTATVLAYDLYLQGFQAIDIGHIDVEFEWFLRKSEVREQIPGKWVAEVGGMKEDTLSDNIVYAKQILDIVVDEKKGQC